MPRGISDPEKAAVIAQILRRQQERNAAITTRQAIKSVTRMQEAFGGDPFGTRTLAGAQAAYVRGAIDVDEFERRVERLLTEAPDVL